eukprot:CAMPEP_0116894252 /NCGR_PEP_ID=MMETSP0467-20121206/4067_1 /TAXON_ID=283647 /ORGANISM="Mesodinium pulex, Strain SPMC105" /LENGTH=120 /DNA_ID=CAMNT_0004564379 /DNA_START=190 /DNA_END=552 /DNA_ORIENTATION=-
MNPEEDRDRENKDAEFDAKRESSTKNDKSTPCNRGHPSQSQSVNSKMILFQLDQKNCGRYPTNLYTEQESLHSLKTIRSYNHKLAPVWRNNEQNIFRKGFQPITTDMKKKLKKFELPIKE